MGFVLSRVLKKCKNVLNKARRKLRMEFKRRKIKEIERLRFNKAGEYWKKLKEVAGRKKRRNNTVPTALNEEGKEVIGKEVKVVWKKAFEKLGKVYNSGKYFDDSFETRVEEELK